MGHGGGRLTGARTDGRTGRQDTGADMTWVRWMDGQTDGWDMGGHGDRGTDGRTRQRRHEYTGGTRDMVTDEWTATPDKEPRTTQ